MKLVSLQKGVVNDRYDCVVYRKKDLIKEEEISFNDEVGADTEAAEDGSHTLEELKQINHQLYKYSLKHVLNSR